MNNNSSIEAYPLQWPVGYKRTPKHEKKNAAFQTRFAAARDACIREVELLTHGDASPIISSDIPLKRDGTPYAVEWNGSRKISDDTGIAVYFKYGNEMKVICCDAFLSFDDNMQAIRKSIEALRGLDRWKCSDIINQTFTGFKALPEKTSFSGKTIWQILGLNEKPENTIIIHQAYKKKKKKLHPDAPGGSAEAFNELQKAYEQALSHFNVVIT